MQWQLDLSFEQVQLEPHLSIGKVKFKAFSNPDRGLQGCMHVDWNLKKLGQPSFDVITAKITKENIIVSAPWFPLFCLISSSQRERSILCLG